MGIKVVNKIIDEQKTDRTRQLQKEINRKAIYFTSFIEYRTSLI